MTSTEPLLPGEFYHVYNRGNNRENIFAEERNYGYFMELYAQYIEPVAATYAYCLLRNHFHLLIRIRDVADFPQDCQSSRGRAQDWQSSEDCQSSRGRAQDCQSSRAYDSAARYVSRQFADLFATYSKAFNKAYNRTGSLFAKPFRRKRVDSDGYFRALVVYIHQNPQRHGFVSDFRDWPYSSYAAIAGRARTHVQRSAVLSWFDNRNAYLATHHILVDELSIEPLLFD